MFLTLQDAIRKEKCKKALVSCMAVNRRLCSFFRAVYTSQEGERKEESITRTTHALQ